MDWGMPALPKLEKAVDEGGKRAKMGEGPLEQLTATVGSTRRTLKGKR